MTGRAWIILLAVATATAGPALAAEPPAAPPAAAASTPAAAAAIHEAPADEPITEARVADIVARLGHEKYLERERAQRQLNALPASAMAWIARYHQQADDPEITIRLERYAEHYFDTQVMPAFAKRLGWPAFLGIVTGVGLTEDGRGIIIAERVLPDTAAADAGLKDGDQILAFNGQALPTENTMIVFQQTIRQAGYGAKVRLTVVREGKQFELTPRLRGVPADQLTTDQGQAQAAVRKRLFDRWWRQAFLQGKADLPDDAWPQLAPPAAGATPDPLARPTIVLPPHQIGDE